MRLEVLIDLDVELLAIRVRVVSNKRLVIKLRIPDFARQDVSVVRFNDAIATKIVLEVIRLRKGSQDLSEVSGLIKAARSPGIPGCGAGGRSHGHPSVGMSCAVGGAGTKAGVGSARKWSAADCRGTKNTETNEPARVRSATQPD